jgi:(p)ppGpp synthase/HD superfamily hydrolase
MSANRVSAAGVMSAHNHWSQEIYIKAYKFAAHAHQGQLIPGTDLPYLMHLSLVSIEVLAALQGENECAANFALQCALLHDVIEDTSVTYEQVKREFGLQVADGVLALSKDKTLAEPLQMNDSLRRIRQQPKEVWMVKLADRITNLQPPPSYWTKARAKQYREEALAIYAALKEANEALASRLLTKIEKYKVFVE